MSRILASILAIVLPSVVSAAPSHEKRLEEAVIVLTEITEAADRGIPQFLIDRSHCIVVIPGMKKGAFVFGARYGRGFASCREREGGAWSAPAAVRVEGGSFGAQIGGKETDVVLLVMNERGADRLMSSRFTLGGQASIAAGPIGRTASAETDAFVTAEILSYSRARGLFAGLSLNGSTLREDRSTNRSLYGRELGTRDIVRGGMQPAHHAEGFMTALNKVSAEGTRARQQEAR